MECDPFTRIKSPFFMKSCTGLRASSAVAWVSLTGTATVNQGIPLAAQYSSYELKGYRGQVAATTSNGLTATLAVTRGRK